MSLKRRLKRENLTPEEQEIYNVLRMKVNKAQKEFYDTSIELFRFLDDTPLNKEAPWFPHVNVSAFVKVRTAQDEETVITMFSYGENRISLDEKEYNKPENRNHRNFFFLGLHEEGDE